VQAILHDGKLLGRIIDTFVTQQLRGELLGPGLSPPATS
jgi:hypothetical protein